MSNFLTSTFQHISHHFVTYGLKLPRFLVILFILSIVLFQSPFVFAEIKFVEAKYLESEKYPFPRKDVVGSNAIPSFADIDDDNYLDAFIGEGNGIDTISFYKNVNGLFEQGHVNPLANINVRLDGAPALVDIDNDGDIDAFIGNGDGSILYYRNDNSTFVEQTGGDNPLNMVNMTANSTIAFGDIDKDGDFDAFIGANNGEIYYYKNTGSVENPVFEVQTVTSNPFNNFDVGNGSVPTLGDIDGDGDLDALIGEDGGSIKYFKNISDDANTPNFEEQTGANNPFDGVDFGMRSAPSLVDFDGDGDLDVFIGAGDGTVRYFTNMPIPNISIFPTNHNFSEQENPNPSIVMPNDSDFGELWALHNTGENGGKVGADIGATKAWGITTGNESFTCAVLDSGVDSDHPDLKDNLVPGWNFIDDNDDTSDNCGHGTQVAGIIGAVGNNEFGITGVNWSVKIMPLVVAELKVLPNSRESVCVATDDAIIKALKHAQDQEVKCVNISLGAASSFNQELFDAIQNYNGLVIAAVGNDYGQDNDEIPFYPASYNLDNILSVCATDRTDRLAAVSNIGYLSVDLCAPGSGIMSTYLDGDYIENTGTSMSTAYVSGAVSLLWSAFPTLTTLKIKEHLIQSADYLPKLRYNKLSVGRLNVYQALLRLQPQIFTISNTGKSNLKIDQIQLMGENASAFNLNSNDNCFFESLIPNSELCFVEVLFDSNEPGDKVAVLEVLSNAPQIATAQLSGFVKDHKPTVGRIGDGELLPTLKRAKPAVYHVATGEVEIPTVVVPNNKGYADIYQVKLCSVNNNPLLFASCYIALVDSRNKILGDTLFDADTGTVHIPGVEVDDTGIFYEVTLQMLTNSEGEFEFEVSKLIQVVQIKIEPPPKF